MTLPSRRRVARSSCGFTLAELLLASVLGAMLLTALAVSTFGFTVNLDYLEAKAGVGSDIDPVLRRMTRDIREAWWVEKVSPSKLRIAAPDGSLTEYYRSGDKLYLKRPNGDLGVIFDGLDNLVLDVSTVSRSRESTPADHDGVWLSQPVQATSVALEVPVSGQLALGFVAPVVPADIPGQGSADEQVLSVQASSFSLPVAFISGSGQKNLQASLYESWAPGKGRPDGAALATTSVSGLSLPAAEWSSGAWQVPSQMVQLSLSAPLEPGVGYTLVVSATGNSKLLFNAGVISPADQDEVALQSTLGGNFVVQPLLVPFSVSGPFQLTTTQQQSVVNRVSLTAYPSGEEPRQRSASVLSQSYSSDPWLGVVPGQAAP